MKKSCENCRCQYSVDYCFDCNDFDRYLPDYQTLESELQQYKEALKTIKTYSSGPIIAIGESDGEDGFPEGSVYGYNLAIEQIVNEVINPLLGESKPKEDDDD